MSGRGFGLSPQVAATLAVAFVALLVGFWLTAPPKVESDSRVLVAGASAAVDCLGRGVFSDCGATRAELARARPPYPLESAVGPFPILQYVPAAVLLRLGRSQQSALGALAAINVAAFVLLLFVLWRTVVRVTRREAAAAFVVVAMAGPLFVYAHSTFGEMTGALLATCFVAAVATGRHWLVVAAALWIAGLTKETAVPVLVLLGLTALLARPGRDDRRVVLLAFALGGALALATNALFNVFRYASIRNGDYLDGPEKLFGIDTVPLAQRAKYAVGLLSSPNGGLALFWPVATALLAGAAVLAIRTLRTGRRERRLAAGAFLAVPVLLIAGLASWYQPYGWFAWGPRLLLPWIPPLLLVAAVLFPEALERGGDILTATRTRLAVAAGVVWLATLPQLAVLWNPGLHETFFRYDASCRSPLRGQAYFDCVDHLAWGKKPVLVSALGGLRLAPTPSLVFAAALLVAVAAILVLARDRLSREVAPRTGPQLP